jgi:hypothetical protein
VDSVQEGARGRVGDEGEHRGRGNISSIKPTNSAESSQCTASIYSGQTIGGRMMKSRSQQNMRIITRSVWSVPDKEGPEGQSIDNSFKFTCDHSYPAGWKCLGTSSINSFILAATPHAGRRLRLRTLC